MSNADAIVALLSDLYVQLAELRAENQRLREQLQAQSNGKAPQAEPVLEER